MTTTEPAVDLFAEPSTFRQSAEVGDLYAAIVDAFGAITNVATDGHANAGQYDYSYATIGQIMSVVRGPLAEAGLAIIQAPSVMQGPNGREVEIATRLIHRSGQWTETATTIAVDGRANAQAVGSAMTYARRYGLLAMLCLATGDDDGAAAAASPPGDYERPAADRSLDRKDAVKRITELMDLAVHELDPAAPKEAIVDLAKRFWDEFLAEATAPYSASAIEAHGKNMPLWVRSHQPSNEAQADAQRPLTAAPAPEGPDDATEAVEAAPDLSIEQLVAIEERVAAMSGPDVRKALNEMGRDSAGPIADARNRLAQVAAEAAEAAEAQAARDAEQEA